MRCINANTKAGVKFHLFWKPKSDYIIKQKTKKSNLFLPVNSCCVPLFSQLLAVFLHLPDHVVSAFLRHLPPSSAPSNEINVKLHKQISYNN